MYSHEHTANVSYTCINAQVVTGDSWHTIVLAISGKLALVLREGTAACILLQRWEHLSFSSGNAHRFQTLKMINTSLMNCTHATQMSIWMLKEIDWFNLITARRFSWVHLLSSRHGLSSMSSWFVERKMLAELLATFNVFCNAGGDA